MMCVVFIMDQTLGLLFTQSRIKIAEVGTTHHFTSEEKAAQSS